MPSRLAVLALASALVGGAWVAPSRAARTPGEPTLGLLESGTSAYLHGTYVWTDYAYDDHGSSRTATYPDARDQGNAADLVQLQLGLHGDALRITGVLETLTHQGIPLLAVGLDLDGNPGTGAPTMPGWTAKGALGLDRLVVITSKGASVSRWGGATWQRQQRLPARVDTTANVMRTDVPGLALGRSVRVAAQVGIVGTAAPYDLAFVRAEDPTNGSSLASAQQVAVSGEGHATGGEWQDRLQGEVLAGTRDARTALATVDVEALRHHASRLPDRTRPGYHTWLYRSHVPLPEGIVDGTPGGGLFAGPYQPYVVQVPVHPDGSAVLSLHGGGGNHLENGTFAPQGDLRLNRSFGVFPFGREVTTANDHGYQGVSERDVLDALDDALLHNAIDPTGVVVTGISTGGGGAYRFAQLHPDRFSGVLVASAYDDSHLPENLVDLPVVFHNGGVDPLASQPLISATTTELDQLGYVDYRSYSVTAHQHADLTGAVTQCVLDRLTAHRVVAKPGRVVVALDPRTEVAGLELGHGQAYWVRAARLRPGVTPSVWHTPEGDPPAYGDDTAGQVDLTTSGVARRTRTGTMVNAVGENVTAGADLCGPNPSVRTNDVWRVHGMAQALGAPQPRANALSGSLREIGALSVDLPRAGLSTTAPLVLTLDGDGATTVTLLGPWRHPVRLLRDGSLIGTARPRAGALVLRLPAAGHHTFEIR